MLNQNIMKRILDRAMDMSTADETQVSVGYHRSSLTRFAENHIHQNVSENNVHLSVTAVIGNKMGAASTNKLDDESIKRVAADAAEIAGFVPPDDELLPRLVPQEYSQVDAYDPAVDNITSMDRAQSVAEVVELCKENGLKTAGALSDGSGCSVLGNSSGLFAFHQSSGVNFSMTALGDDSSGWAGRSSHRASEINTGTLGKIAVEKAIKSREPKVIPLANTLLSWNLRQSA